MNRPVYEETVRVGLEHADREFDVVDKLSGKSGSNFQFISKETGATVELRGRGSGQGRESQDPLHFYIVHWSSKEALAVASKLILDLIESVRDDYNEYQKYKSRTQGREMQSARSLQYDERRQESNRQSNHSESDYYDRRQSERRYPSEGDCEWRNRSYREENSDDDVDRNRWQSGREQYRGQGDGGSGFDTWRSPDHSGGYYHGQDDQTSRPERPGALQLKLGEDYSDKLCLKRDTSKSENRDQFFTNRGKRELRDEGEHRFEIRGEHSFGARDDYENRGGPRFGCRGEPGLGVGDERNFENRGGPRFDKRGEHRLENRGEPSLGVRDECNFENRGESWFENRGDHKPGIRDEFNFENRGESWFENRGDHKPGIRDEFNFENRGEQSFEDRGESRFDNRGDHRLGNRGEPRIENRAGSGLVNRDKYRFENKRDFRGENRESRSPEYEGRLVEEHSFEGRGGYARGGSCDRGTRTQAYSDNRGNCRTWDQGGKTKRTEIDYDQPKKKYRWDNSLDYDDSGDKSVIGVVMDQKQKIEEKLKKVKDEKKTWPSVTMPERQQPPMLDGGVANPLQMTQDQLLQLNHKQLLQVSQQQQALLLQLTSGKSQMGIALQEQAEAPLQRQGRRLDMAQQIQLGQAQKSSVGISQQLQLGIANQLGTAEQIALAVQNEIESVLKSRIEMSMQRQFKAGLKNLMKTETSGVESAAGSSHQSREGNTKVGLSQPHWLESGAYVADGNASRKEQRRRDIQSSDLDGVPWTSDLSKEYRETLPRRKSPDIVSEPSTSHLSSREVMYPIRLYKDRRSAVAPSKAGGSDQHSPKLNEGQERYSPQLDEEDNLYIDNPKSSRRSRDSAEDWSRSEADRKKEDADRKIKKLMRYRVGVVDKAGRKLTGEDGDLIKKLVAKAQLAQSKTFANRIEFKGLDFQDYLYVLLPLTLEGMSWLVNLAVLTSERGKDYVLFSYDDIYLSYTLRTTIYADTLEGYQPTQEEVVMELGRLNEGLNTGLWKVIKFNFENKGYFMLLSVDLLSYLQVRRMVWRLKYRTSFIRLEPPRRGRPLDQRFT